MGREKRDNLAAIVLAILLAYLTYWVVQGQLPQIFADYNGHTYVYLPLFTEENWWKGWMAVPYCMWHLGVLGVHHILHIPLNIAAAYVSIFFSMLSYFIMYWMIIKYTSALGKELSTTKAAFLSFALSVSQALYFEWLDAGTRFLGTFSMNPLHNPTQMAVNPFSLLCFCLVYDIWNKQDDEGYKGIFFDTQKGLKKPFIYLAVVLLLSAMTKPTFAEMFIPAVAIVMLIKWIGCIIKKDGSGSVYFKKCLQMLYCAIPALLFILIAFLAYFLFGGSYGADGSFMITKWMEVWSMFTDNVVLSIALGMAFPLFLIMIDASFFWKDNMGKLALTGYIIGFLEAALLGEGGSKLSHADFIWPMMSGMLLMWMASTLHLLKLEKEHGNTKVKCVLIDVAWVIFCLHVLCGLLYIKELSGGI
ncbi:MAG: hypothetical protein E7286_03740 [Lachnospiraceae bacterium]|nr:hypothetical protein [Lachnospiraceae bacterium]